MNTPWRVGIGVFLLAGVLIWAANSQPSKRAPGGTTFKDLPERDLLDINSVTSRELEELGFTEEEIRAILIARRKNGQFKSLRELQEQGVLGEEGYRRARRTLMTPKQEEPPEPVPGAPDQSAD